MTSALSPIRALIVAVSCIALFAVWSPLALAQEVPVTGSGDVVVDQPPPPAPVDPPPVDPAPVDPAPPPPVDSTPADPPPADQPPADQPPADSTPVDPQADHSSTVRDDAGSRPESNRTPAAASPQNATTTTVPSDVFATPAQLPPAGPGEDFALTGKGDAFIFGSGGTSGGGPPTALLSSLSHFGSIATAATRIPALGARERAARQAAQAAANQSGIVTVDDVGSAGLFLKMFGGGGGGGAAMMLITVLGILAVIRLLPPEGIKDFLTSTAVWRPSAYVPPIEHPG